MTFGDILMVMSVMLIIINMELGVLRFFLTLRNIDIKAKMITEVRIKLFSIILVICMCRLVIAIVEVEPLTQYIVYVILFSICIFGEKWLYSNF